MHLPVLLSQLLSLPSPVNPTVSVVAPVAANTAFDNMLCTLIATYTGADVTVVGDIIVLNNPTFSAAMGASVVFTHSELVQHLHIILL